MKKKYILSGLLASIFLFTSCESRLDIAEHGVSNVSTYYQTDDEANEAATAMYYRCFTTYNSWFMINNLLSDDCWSGGGTHYDGSFYKLADYTFDTDYGTIKTLYTNLYNTIYAANVVLENVKGESTIKNRAIAEAHVFRALSYFELTTLWGTPPLVDHTLQPNEYQQGNSDQSALWALIESDLTSAINSNALTEKSNVDDKTYRVTKQYAQALLGKVYVFEKKWSDAINMFDQVIQSGKYKLYEDYSNIGTMAGECNCESLFEINRPNDTSNPSLNFDLLWDYLGLRGEKYNVSGSTLSGRSWGFMNPTKDLYDAFVVEEGADGYRLHNSIITYQQLKDEQKAYISDGLTVTDNEGYYDFKWRILGSDFSLAYNVPKNFRFMRYAEVLLLAAEANLEAGSANKALEYVNQVRSRAKAKNLTSITMDNIKTEKTSRTMLRSMSLSRFDSLGAMLHQY
jgi:hypothetical protein